MLIMFERDADDAREATERGKKNMRFKDLMDSIWYECNDCQRFGSSKASYKLRDEDIAEFLDDIIDALQSRDYSVNFTHPYLEISWGSSEE